MNTLVKLLELIRFSHTLFALPFALLAAVLAWNTPSPVGDAGFNWVHLLGILVCMVGARSAAMAFNRLADWRFDAENPRTRGRHLPRGTLSAASVAAFTAASAALFFAGTLLFLPNILPLLLAAPVLLWLLGYSYAKRFTWLSHVWLGAALALAPVCVWLALRGPLVLQDPSDLVPAWILAAVVLSWVTGFDLIYACLDQQFDAEAGLSSVPARFGVPVALRLAAACHALTAALLVLLPLLARSSGHPLPLGWLYWVAVVIIGGLLAYQHLLVRPDDLTRVNQAFFGVNAVVSVGLLLMVSLDVLVIRSGVPAVY